MKGKLLRLFGAKPERSGARNGPVTKQQNYEESVRFCCFGMRPKPAKLDKRSSPNLANTYDQKTVYLRFNNYECLR